MCRSIARVFKIDVEIGNACPSCICGIALPQTRRLLPRIRHFPPKMRKASSEECWLGTMIVLFEQLDNRASMVSCMLTSNIVAVMDFLLPTYVPVDHTQAAAACHLSAA